MKSVTTCGQRPISFSVHWPLPPNVPTFVIKRKSLHGDKSIHNFCLLIYMSGYLKLNVVLVVVDGLLSPK